MKAKRCLVVVLSMLMTACTTMHLILGVAAVVTYKIFDDSFEDSLD